MSVETEIKFLLPAPVARALSRDLFPAAVARADHLDTTYFDTPAGHLEAAKVALRLRLSDNRITQTIKTAPRASGPFSRGEVERVLSAPRLVLDDLKQVLSPRAYSHVTRTGVAPTFRTVFDRRRRLFRHTARSGAISTIELALDQGEIDTSRASHPICELELELKSGPPEGLLDLARDLQSRYGLRLSIDSKAARAARLHHGAAPDIWRAPPLNFTAETRIAEAYPAIVQACLTQFIANHENVLEVGAPEAIHQMRVSIRRLRSANGVFKPIIAAARVAPALALLKDIFEALGRVRDIDVLIAETFDKLAGMGLDKTQMAQLTPHLAAWREAELARVRALLETGDQWRAVFDIALWIETGAWRNIEDPVGRLWHARRLAEFAGPALDRRYRNVVKRARRATRDPLEWHRVRLDVKKLRYNAEFFVDACAGKTARAFARELRQLQEQLGALNDLAVAADILAAAPPAADPMVANVIPRVRGFIEGAAAAALPGIVARLRKRWRTFAARPMFWAQSRTDAGRRP